MKSINCLLAASLLLGGCTLGPDYHRIDSPLPKTYAEAGEQKTAAVNRQWWKLYHDPVLDQLVATALTENADVRIAAAKVEEADAQLRVVGAALFPEIDLGGTANRTKPSQATGVPVFGQNVRNNFKLNLNTAFELDFWGKLRRADEGARAQVLATDYARSTVELTLVTLVVQNYLSLRSLDAQIAESRDMVQSWQAEIDILQARAGAGLQSDLDVEQVKNQRQQAQAQLADLEGSRALAQHQLAFLAGKPELSIASGDLRALPVPPAPPAGLPSGLLESRPDIRQSEEQLVAANANIGFAKAALFPTITLTGTAGGESKALSDIGSRSATAWTFGLGLNLPVLDAGKRRALVDQANAQQKQALIGYQKSLQTAFKEVNDALSNLRQSTASEQALQERTESAQRALVLTEERYQAGYSPYLDLLNAKISRNNATLALIAKRQAKLSATADLFKSLGGGWQASEHANAE